MLTAFLELIKGRYAENLQEEHKQIIQRFVEELYQSQSPTLVILRQLKVDLLFFINI